MPIWLDYISFLIGVGGLLLTFRTFLNTRDFRKMLVQREERIELTKEMHALLSKIDAYINSINEDKIYVRDNDRTFRPSLSQFLTDLLTRFSFLSAPTQKKIKSLQKTIHNPNLTADEWNHIANELIVIKNHLKKELL